MSPGRGGCWGSMSGGNACAIHNVAYPVLPDRPGIPPVPCCAFTFCKPAVRAVASAASAPSRRS
eukprot:3352492-Lingulodinium_polyedra.AAC.1